MYQSNLTVRTRTVLECLMLLSSALQDLVQHTG